MPQFMLSVAGEAPVALIEGSKISAGNDDTFLVLDNLGAIVATVWLRPSWHLADVDSVVHGGSDAEFRSDV
jgi:hypothetical protein